MRLHCLCLTLGALTSGLAGQEPRLVNVSTRTNVGLGADVLTAGFYLSGTTPKQVVIRAVGPSLANAPFNVPGVLADPELIVYGPDSSTVIAASNDNWNVAHAATFASVGAFALQDRSRDAAVVATLAPGSYTAVVRGVGNTVGNAIVEVYEVGATSGRFANLSCRAPVAGTSVVLTPGFVITAGTGTRKLLIRAAGPALTQLGLAGAIANPSLALYNNATRATVASNDDWGSPVGSSSASAALLAGAFSQAAAFPFPAGSRDAAILVDLPPGNYTVQVSGVTGAAGLALAEIYELTPNAEPPVTPVASRTPFLDALYETTVTSDLQYGTGSVGNPASAQIPLHLDLYRPVGPALPATLPGFVVIHGGGFVGGSKSDGAIVQLCQAYAKRGYVTASIRYRLVGDNPTLEPGPTPGTTAQLRSMNAAAQDAAKAVRWLRANAASFGVDPDRIAIGGGSAGAITALFTGYQEAGTIGPNARVSVILDLWGGMYGGESLIDADDPPVFIVHGTADLTVAFTESQNLVARLNSIGLDYRYFPIQDAGHSAWQPFFNNLVGGKTIDRHCAEFFFKTPGLSEIR